MQLQEQYRPRTFEEVAGQESAVTEIRTTIKRSWGGRAWWISGLSGTGKTTLAKLIAAEGADDFGTEELDAGRMTVNKVAELEETMRYRAMGAKQGKAFIVNEAHAMPRKVVTELLTLLDRLPEHVCIIFTTTKAGQAKLFEDTDDTGPLLSRCHEVELSSSPKSRAAMAQRAKEIAMREGIDGLPEQFYKDALEGCQGNMRRLLQRIESGGFKKDVEQREGWRKELSMLASTKGERAEARRAELRKLLGE